MNGMDGSIEEVFGELPSRNVLSDLHMELLEISVEKNQRSGPNIKTQVPR